MYIRSKKQASAEIINSIEDIRHLRMTRQGKAYLEDTEFLAYLMQGYPNATEEKMESMKMQDLRTAIQEANELIALIQ